MNLRILSAATLLVFTACFAACGNGSGAGSPDAGTGAVTIGGSVAGLSGTLVLTDNTTDVLTLTMNGAFTFAASLQSGAAYDVVVKTQPANQQCAITYGAGTAVVSIASIAVLCTTNVQTGQRALPAIYSTGRAVGYSGYRAGGPGAGEVPTDAQITQDLQLLAGAGFNLIRLFGADAFTTATLRLAAATQPSMKFQLGIYLEGAGTDCADTVNSTEMSTAISLANQYSNVVAVSVGNETSFAANLPVACLVQYIRDVRGQVAQPVTADDDYTFYAGRTASGEKPDTVFGELDFLSIHIYPFADIGLWNWEQTGVAAGPDRATAMMAASLVEAKSAYAAVANYQYKNASGITVKVSDGLLISVGESGWKARPTNQSAIEQVTNPAIANPVNAKEYLDLLGTWGGTGAGAPVAIFYFEAFDEPWKGTDDGWGLWDVTRAPRYALCGLGAGAACNSDLYSGAGWYH